MTPAIEWEREYAIKKQRETLRKGSEAEVDAVFTSAGFKIETKWELANMYWPDSPIYDDVRKPWWLVKTDIGLITFGRRKRVWSIDWSECKVRHIVTTDDVTKGIASVHAYTLDKAIEYMKALHKAATLETGSEDT